jgi:hypothetical protein
MVSDRITFGVEIECVLPSALVLDASALKLARGVKPVGWKAVPDGSIRAPEGFTAVEFVSPKLVGEAGLTAAVAVVERLAALGARVNDSCGLHVHISSKGWESDADFLLEAFMAVQSKFLALGGRAANAYCQELAGDPRWLEVHKYQTLTVWQPGKGAEIRAFAGTLEPEAFRHRLELALYFWQGMMISNSNLGGTWDYVLEVALEDGGAPAELIDWVKAAGLWNDPAAEFEF